MAEITGHGFVGNDKYWLFDWDNLKLNDTGKPVRVSHMADKTVSIDGTFGASGNCRMEGSMDGTNWFTLNNPLGSPINLTSASVEAILENPRFIRPNVSDGDGTTDINVHLGASASK